MAKCPKCGTPGAYIGLSSVECKNSKCEAFKLTEEVICPCCGIAGHIALEGLPKYLEAKDANKQDGGGVSS